MNRNERHLIAVDLDDRILSELFSLNVMMEKAVVLLKLTL